MEKGRNRKQDGERRIAARKGRYGGKEEKCVAKVIKEGTWRRKRDENEMKRVITEGTETRTRGKENGVKEESQRERHRGERKKENGMERKSQ